MSAGHGATIKRLQDWIALPTIAAEERNVEEGADYMAQLAPDAGFQQARMVPTGGMPGVFATLDAGAKDTLGIYFMYDVKQFDPAEWASPPLEARIVDRPGEGKAIVGRGAVNQKGPGDRLPRRAPRLPRRQRKLPVNLVLLAEGEEEIGSPHFHQIVADPEVLAAIKQVGRRHHPSAAQGANGDATISLGAKGAVELQLIVERRELGARAEQDIHSSLMARVDSPAWHLVKALNTLVAEDGHTPAVEGWFENVQPLTERQKALIAEAVAAGRRGGSQAGARRPALDQGRDFLTSSLAARVAADDQYPGPGRRLYRAGRQDRACRAAPTPRSTCGWCPT